MNERLGRRALTYLSVWVAALLWTLSYSEGAGFGAAAYQNECSHGQVGICPLVYHPLFPPQVSIPAFVGNLATLWVDGVYDTGLLFAIVISVGLLLIASRMNSYVAERVFSWPLSMLGCVVFAVAGYFYEVHQTLSTGVASVPLL